MGCSLENIVSLALLSSFMILLITKIGLREYAQTFGPKLISKMFNCGFCLSFWCNVLLSFIFSIFVFEGLEFLLCPLLATPITRKMI